MDYKRREISLPQREYVVKFWKEGKSQREISKLMDIPRSTIQYILKKFKEDKITVNKPRQGRPKLLTNREESRILRAVKQDSSISTPEIQEKVLIPLGKSVSCDTIRRVLYRANLNSRSSRKRPLITVKNSKKRLEFANKYISKSEEFWKRVIFTDESKFCVFNAPSKKVWRKPNTEFQKENLTQTVKHGGASLMVWGCMSAAGVGDYHIIDGTMDRWMYLNILKEHLLQSAEKFGIKDNFMFQQDNDPKHKATIVREWILYNTPHYLVTPPQSPDINPIEHLWAEIKKNIRKSPPRNRDELKQRFIEEWEKIPSDFTEKLVKSMSKRLKAIISSKGYHTRY
ncbi:Transposable element Tcb1 transposase [Anthophora quadrimaculata]